jgi:hypothetical protein
MNGWRVGYQDICPSGSEGNAPKLGLETDQGTVCLPYCRESGQKAKALWLEEDLVPCNTVRAGLLKPQSQLTEEHDLWQKA